MNLVCLIRKMHILEAFRRNETRLMVAKAMVHDPPILILDEPTAGVDVELRKNMGFNKKLNKKGSQ